MKNDTIAAIATALGSSAVNIVRMSGDDALRIAGSFFSGTALERVPSHTIHYGRIVEDGTVIDEVLVSVFRAPRSFTCEDMVEINCHGGPYVTQKILGLLLGAGARLAERGEFTERAFLNGRIDLTQAESILDIIEARSDASLSLANKGLAGSVTKLVDALREDILAMLAHIEVNIDYPEYDIEDLTPDVLGPKLEGLLDRIDDILRKAKDGQVIREGVRTAIIGRPNVGKSSLLNALLEEEKAIVTDIRGTTRDTVEGHINLGGITLHLLDTAGIHDADNPVERIGVDKAKKAIEEAQLVLVVLDRSVPLENDDRTLLALTEKKNRLLILNKSDLTSKIAENLEDALPVSALKKTGIDELKQAIHERFLSGEIDPDSAFCLANARHIGLMKKARAALADAEVASRRQTSADLLGIDLKSAWDALGDITGASYSTSLLDTLFSRFCLGK